MKISYMEHVTNETVLERVDQNRKLVKTCKLKYFSHVSCHTSLEKDIMLRTTPGLSKKPSTCIAPCMVYRPL